MSFRVEMGSVAFPLILEIYPAESVALGEDVAVAGRVEYRDASCSAYIYGCVDNLPEIIVLEILAVPGGEEKYACRGISLNEAVA